MKEIDLSTTLFKIASKVFDFVIFKTESGAWMQTDSFNRASKIYHNSNIFFYNFIIKFSKKLNLKKLTSFLNDSYLKKNRKKNSNFVFCFKSLLNSNYFTLFDIFELDKPYNKELYEFIVRNKNFSLKHGSIPEISDNHRITKKLDIENSVIYALTNLEIDHYKNVYNLNKSQIKVFGNPRHEKNWIKYLIKDNQELSSGKKVLLISRPDTTYLPKKKKIEFLKMIKAVTDKYNLQVIVKLHPKEIDKKIYKKIFGTNTYGDRWLFSNKHPLILGQESKFAISFYSGVPIDLIKLGIPSIELLDLKNISKYDNEHSLRDVHNEPVFKVRYLKLVLGTSNTQGLEKYVLEILSNRKQIIKELNKRYDSIFPSSENSSELISKDILEKNNKIKFIFVYFNVLRIYFMQIIDY